MKWFLLFLCWSGAIYSTSGQNENEDKPTPYLHRAFEKGTLYYRATPPQTADLNYHKVSEEMVMKLRQHMVPINDIEAVDSIRLKDMTFIRVENKFYELLSSHDMQLLVQHRSTSQEAAKTGAYGTVAHTGGVEVLGSMERHVEFYALFWDEQKSIINRTEYWVKDGVKFHKSNNFKQLSSVFPDKKKALKSFISQYKLRLDNPADLKRAFEFCMVD